MNEQVPREKSWVPTGYLAANRDRGLVVIMIADALEVLSGRRPFTKVLLRKR